jgi:hypothetical protein
MNARLSLDPPIPLIEAFPQLVKPLEDALFEADEELLAASVRRMDVHALCGCRDSFCGSFETAEDDRELTSDGRTIALGGDSPLTPIAVDVENDGVRERIYFVEIINANKPAMVEFKHRYDELTRRASGSAE